MNAKKAACEEGYKCVFTPEQEARCEVDVQAMEVIRICRLNSDPGPCAAAIPRMYFDKNNAKCENFTYGGCQGNNNRFETIQECMDKCGHVGVCPVAGEMTAPAGCTVESDISLEGCPHQKSVCPGTGCEKEPCQECEKCNNEWPIDCEPQYASGAPVPPGAVTQAPCMPSGRICIRDPVCEKFKCDATECRRGSKCVWKEIKGIRGATCEKVEFPRQTLETCQKAKREGNCGGAVPSWYYNSKSGRCEQFTHGRCYYSANRFDTKEECEELCDDIPAPDDLAKLSFED